MTLLTLLGIVVLLGTGSTIAYAGHTANKHIMRKLLNVIASFHIVVKHHVIVIKCFIDALRANNE